MMTGIYQPEEGEILYKAIPIHLPTPESAHKVGSPPFTGNRAV
nr:Uncharacterised protein [Klebsiella pneumoniae]